MQSTAETSYRARILNMNLFNCFPSIPRQKYLIYQKSPNQTETLTIPAGNWNAYTLAEYLTEFFKLNPPTQGIVSVSYDNLSNRFLFTPSVVILETDAARELGLISTPDGYLPLGEVNLSGVTNIQVMTSWSAANIPITGKLATIPNNAYFTEEIQFYEAAGDPFLIVNQDISSLEVDLLDQYGNSLMEWLPEVEGYRLPNWSLTILLDVFYVVEQR